jgi:signal transduction histidine kinase
MDRAQSEVLWDELQRMAHLGQLAGPLAHEFNNFLNLLVLNLAVLEKQVPRELRPDLVELRKQGAEFGKLVKQFQDLRRRSSTCCPPLEINPLLSEVAEHLVRQPTGAAGRALRLATSQSAPEVAEDMVTLVLELAPNLPSPPVSPLELQHLVAYLLKNAATAAKRPGGKVVLESSASEGSIHIKVADNGPRISLDTTGRLFEASAAVRKGTDNLELAACKSIAHRLNGTIKAENLDGGGLAVTVSFPVDQEPL